MSNIAKGRIFNNKQILKIVASTFIPTFLSLIFEPYIVVSDSFYSSALQINLILFGFVLTSLTMIGSVLGSSLVERLKEVGAYHSLMTNFYWLSILLFINICISLVVALTSLNMDFKFARVLLVFDISLTLSLLWFGITRLARLMRNI